MKKLIFAFVVAFSVLATAQPIDRFVKVHNGLYRGARPDLAGLQFLAAKGFRTIVNLDDDRNWVQWEIEQAKRLGLRVVSIPLSGFFAPSDHDIDRALSVLSNPKAGGTFIHCQHGRDRTGLVIALHRIEAQGWPARSAREEMLSLGFRPALLGLNFYFKNRSGFYD